MKRFLKYPLIFTILLMLYSCGKDFLEKKPDKEQVVPQTLDDLQAILDDTRNMNLAYPGTQEVSSDNYYLTDQNYNAVAGLTTKNAYIWGSDVFNDHDQNDWSLCYTVVFYSNVVLEVLETISPTEREQSRWNSIKGSALFFRSLAFYNLTQLFAKPFDPSTAETDPGIVIRLKSDINEPSVRSSVRQSYDRIIDDLKEASAVLPDFAAYKTRPSSLACNALLARVYLSMEKYTDAGKMADKCLSVHSTLLDYNLMSKTSIRPFAQFNDEVIFHYTLFGQPISLARIAPSLYDQYDGNDLRKTLYFRLAPGTSLYTYKGSYHGGSTMFGGLATDELFLIRAESYAREDDTDAAMADLNTLMEKRWNNNVQFIPLSADNADDALRKILAERRKSLVFRGLRWSDLRRLNKDPRFRLTLTREVNENLYQLSPGSSAYVFHIPEAVIRNNNIKQND